MKLFITPGLMVGSAITAINLYNMKRSPETDTFRIGMASLIKGVIYGAAWPFALCFMTLDTFNESGKFYRHCVPLSVHNGK